MKPAEKKEKLCLTKHSHCAQIWFKWWDDIIVFANTRASLSSRSAAHVVRFSDEVYLLTCWLKDSTASCASIISSWNLECEELAPMTSHHIYIYNLCILVGRKWHPKLWKKQLIIEEPKPPWSTLTCCSAPHHPAVEPTLHAPRAGYPTNWYHGCWAVPLMLP